MLPIRMEYRHASENVRLDEWRHRRDRAATTERNLAKRKRLFDEHHSDIRDLR
jgi:hypothetical protein